MLIIGKIRSHDIVPNMHQSVKKCIFSAYIRFNKLVRHLRFFTRIFLHTRLFCLHLSDLVRLLSSCLHWGLVFLLIFIIAMQGYVVGVFIIFFFHLLGIYSKGNYCNCDNFRYVNVQSSIFQNRGDFSDRNSLKKDLFLYTKFLQIKNL